MAFLLRVCLPDRPGSLGQVASALGTVGADIEAIEVVERRLDGTAVDDVLVGLPTGALPDTLVSACRSVGGVTVEWISRFAAGGGLFPDLEAVEVMTQDPPAAAARLVEILPTVFRTDWAALLRLSAESGPLKVEHATAAAPDLEGLPFTRPTRRGARRVPVPEGWSGPVGADLVLAVAAIPAGWASGAVADPGRSPVLCDPTMPGDELLAVGRRGGPEFLDSELARLFHLAALAASISSGATAAATAPAG